MIRICIPMYNEASTAGVVLWKIRKVMAEFGRRYEIVVFDDASTDRTPEVLARYSKVLPLKVIRAETRVGYGAALERLLREAVADSAYPKRDVVVTLQGDFTEDPADLVAMVKAIEGGADVVAGVLDANAGALPSGVRFSRWLAPIILGAAFRRAPVSDPLSGFRAYRLIVLKKAFRESDEGRVLTLADGWGANVQLLARTAPYARRIDDSPFQMRNSHRERMSRFRAGPSLRGLLGLRGTVWVQATESQ